MNIFRRDFLKCCIVSAAALGLEISPVGKLRKALAAGVPCVPTYPISDEVFTTLEKTIDPIPPDGAPVPLPCQLAEYAPNYGEFNPDGDKSDFLLPDMQNPPNIVPSGRDPKAATLLTFFTISDVHVADKESPARAMYFGFQYPNPKILNPGTGKLQPAGNTSAYSGVTLYTPHVLDAAVQTINALHKVTPFDFGMALGDACDNNQLNELRWYIDTLDGKMIYPSSGAHLGANHIDYQKPFQAAGLDKSIKWYQAVGNHDQFWMGSAFPTEYIRQTLVGSSILNIGMIGLRPPYYINVDWTNALKQHGYYVGVVDGSKPYGDVIYAGPYQSYDPPPRVAADPSRCSLTINQWMGQFFDTTSQPVGHGFTQKMVIEGFACYHFYPKAGIPLKVIVLDDTDKSGTSDGALDNKRYQWLIKELEDGKKAEELMIICAHIPLHAYGEQQPAEGQPYQYLPIWTTNSSVDENVTEADLLATLHEYPNVIAWISGHVHRNAITPQLATGGTLENSFWTIETPSLRDFPQQFRHFEIVRNSDNTISIFVLDVDPADNPESLPDGSASPAMTSRHYAIGAMQIFGNPVQQGPGMGETTGVYNAQLVKQLTPTMQSIVAAIKPTVSSFQIAGAVSGRKRTVTLNNTVVGSTPTHYMASESSNFSGAAWLPYLSAPTFAVSSGSGRKTIFFKVKDGSGKQSEVVSSSVLG